MHCPNHQLEAAARKEATSQENGIHEIISKSFDIASLIFTPSVLIAQCLAVRMLYVETGQFVILYKCPIFSSSSSGSFKARHFFFEKVRFDHNFSIIQKAFHFTIRICDLNLSFLVVSHFKCHKHTMRCRVPVVDTH